jgi:uncharacterized protein
MTEFTPLQSLLGGALIGAAAVLLMALHGRIAGITGILGGLLPPGAAPDRGWRIAFLGGAVASLLAYRVLVGRMVEFASPASLPVLLIGGVLVGIGVTFGAGCTSGHGVCGLARFSVRSLAAVLTFMAAAATTVFVSRHILGV